MDLPGSAVLFWTGVLKLFSDVVQGYDRSKYDIYGGRKIKISSAENTVEKYI